MTRFKHLKKHDLMHGVVIIEGHVQGLANTRALGESGIPVVVIDTDNCLARYSRYCTRFFYSPGFDKDELAQFLIDLAGKEELEGWMLLPSNDHAVHTIARNRQALGEVYRLITPGKDIIELIYDKKNLLDIAAGLGVSIPSTHYFTSPAEIIPPVLKYPVITRGRFGLSFYKAIKAKALLANDEVELRRQLAHIEEAFGPAMTLTQSVIPYDGSNRTISFTAFCTGGEIRCWWAGRKLREHPWRFGTATFAESMECGECLEPTARLMRKLDYTGICEVEYIRDPADGCYKLIEMNARTWLWVGLARACGVDYAMMAYRFVNGLETEYPADYTKGVKWINYLTDTWFSLRAMLSGKLNPVEYLRSLKGRRITAVFSWKDIMPSFALLLLSFYIARKRG